MNEEQELLFPLPSEDQMRHTLHEEQLKLNGTTLRLLRCRQETKHKQTKEEIEAEKEPNYAIGRARNELVASFYDKDKSKWRDFIRMVVADTLPEAMPEFLRRSKEHIAKLLPKFANVDKVARTDCQTVSSFKDFAEALQRR